MKNNSGKGMNFISDNMPCLILLTQYFVVNSLYKLKVDIIL